MNKAALKSAIIASGICLLLSGFVTLIDFANGGPSLANVLAQLTLIFAVIVGGVSLLVAVITEQAALLDWARKFLNNPDRDKLELLIDSYNKTEDKHLSAALKSEIARVAELSASAANSSKVQAHTYARKTFAESSLDQCSEVRAVSYGDHAYFMDDGYLDRNIRAARKDDCVVRRIYLLKGTIEELDDDTRAQIIRQIEGEVLIRVAYSRTLPSKREQDWLLGSGAKLDSDHVDRVEKTNPANRFIVDKSAMTYSKVVGQGQQNIDGTISVNEQEVLDEIPNFEALWSIAKPLPIDENGKVIGWSATEPPIGSA